MLLRPPERLNVSLRLVYVIPPLHLLNYTLGRRVDVRHSSRDDIISAQWWDSLSVSGLGPMISIKTVVIVQGPAGQEGVAVSRSWQEATERWAAHLESLQENHTVFHKHRIAQLEHWLVFIIDTQTLTINHQRFITHPNLDSSKLSPNHNQDLRNVVLPHDDYYYYQRGPKTRTHSKPYTPQSNKKMDPNLNSEPEVSVQGFSFQTVSFPGP